MFISEFISEEPTIINWIKPETRNPSTFISDPNRVYESLNEFCDKLINEGEDQNSCQGCDSIHCEDCFFQGY